MTILTNTEHTPVLEESGSTETMLNNHANKYEKSNNFLPSDSPDLLCTLARSLLRFLSPYDVIQEGR